MGKSMLMRFVLINAAVFLTVHIIALIANISDVNLPLATWIELPPDFITALKRPWTFITYMFTHYDVWHILFNLLWLYCFGIVFLDHFSEKDFSTAYFAGGFAGAVFYLTGNALFPQIYSHGLLGASAAVLSSTARSFTGMMALPESSDIRQRCATTAVYATAARQVVLRLTALR